MAEPDQTADAQRGFLRTNAEIVLFVGVAFAVHRWRARRNPGCGPAITLRPSPGTVSEHVDDGRQAINFSDINHGGEGRDEVVNVVKEGSMPPSYFTRFGLNEQAKLSKAKMGSLVAGLEKMPEFRKRDSAGI